MIADITSAITGILTAVETLLTPTSGGSGAGATAVAWAAVLALPVLGGTVALARRLIKKAR